MNFSVLLAALLISASALANQADSLTVTSTLSSQESYRLYEFLTVPEVAEQDGRALVKRSANIVCTRFGSYPGDREYECNLSITVDRSGLAILGD